MSIKFCSDGIESEDSDASADDDRPFNRDELAVKALKTVKIKKCTEGLRSVPDVFVYFQEVTI